MKRSLKSIISEFKQFAIRSNVIDVAIGMLIGAGVTPIASSLISDMIMPPIAFFLGNADLSNLFFTIKSGTPQGPYPSLLLAKEAGAVTINYGKFLNTILSFLVVTFVAFMIVKGSNTLNKKAKSDDELKKTKSKVCPFCQSSIADLATKCAYCTSTLD